MTSDGCAWTPATVNLCTARLTIREFTSDDICADYLAWLNDKSLLRYSNQRFYSHTSESAYRYLKSFQGSSNQFLALNTRNGLVGTVTLYVSREHATVDIGIMIGAPHVGLKFGTEALRAIVEEMFHQGARKVTAGTSGANLAMQRLLLALDFNPDGRRERHEVIDGLEHDLLYFAQFSPKPFPTRS